jgi:hypothetical protein
MSNDRSGVGRPWDEGSGAPGARQTAVNIMARPWLFWSAGLLGGAALLVTAPAQSQERTSVFGDVTLGRDRGVSAGVTLTPAGSRIGAGWGLRTTVSTSRYRYESNGVPVRSEDSRVEAAVIRQWSGPWGYVDVGVGARYVNTDLSPDDPSNDRRGVRWRPALSATGIRHLGPWRAQGFASTGLGDDDYYVRGELTRALGAGVRAGAEIVVDGDPNYDRQRYGAVLGYGAETWEVRLTAGASDAPGRTEGYGTIGFSRRF